MKHEIILTELMKKALRKLRKKFPKIIDDLDPTVEQLKQGTFVGDKLQGFFGDVYKARVGSIDQKKGKSGGFRVIYYAITKDKIVYLITIYAKSQQEDLTHNQKQEITELIKNLNEL